MTSQRNTLVIVMKGSMHTSIVEMPAGRRRKRPQIISHTKDLGRCQSFSLVFRGLRIQTAPTLPDNDNAVS
jgi:hypothetical protein